MNISSNFLDDLQDLDNSDDEQEEIQEYNIDLEQSQKQNLIKIQNLNNDEKFINHLKQIKEFSSDQLISQSNEYLIQIEQEIQYLHKDLRDIYINKFSELEQLVTNPVDYAKCVLKIRNNKDITCIDFEKIVQQNQLVAITMSFQQNTNINNDQELTQKGLESVIEMAGIIVQLEDKRQEILQFVESKMERIAPNLSRLVGSRVAAQLIASAGGVERLANTPACNIQVMGNVQKKQNFGIKLDHHKNHMGFFRDLDIVKACPNDQKKQLVRMLSTNSAKCIRIDYMKTSPKGLKGEIIKEQMLKRLEKIQEIKQAKLIKPLTLPDGTIKSKRGGKRLRSMKQKLIMTDIRKLQNRIEMADNNPDYYITDNINCQKMSKIRLKINSKNKVQLNKKQKKKQLLFNNQNQQNNGFVSNIAFTHMQAMELVNPQFINNQQLNQQYFDKNSGFKTVIQQNQTMQL